MTLMNSRHVYTIVAYDAASDLITIHNPYNGGGTETYSDGVKVAVNAEGFFTLSTTQLVKYFNSVWFETGAKCSGVCM